MTEREDYGWRDYAERFAGETREIQDVYGCTPVEAAMMREVAMLNARHAQDSDDDQAERRRDDPWKDEQ